MTKTIQPNECRQDPGVFMPVIDRNSCEGKADCIPACPYNVFTLGILPQAERAKLNLKGRVKGFAHGWRQAFTPNIEACRACGYCVAACPEHAITLQRAS